MISVLHKGDPANDDGVPYIHIYGVFIQETSSHQISTKNIAKGTTDPRVEFSLPRFEQVQSQILIKFHPQNLDQASTSKSQ